VLRFWLGACQFTSTLAGVRFWPEAAEAVRV